MERVHCLWPVPPDAASAGPLTGADLERIYAYPEDLTRPWVQANFVSSADGAVTVADRSEGLSHPADKRIFALGRDLADVILVGAGTVKAEKYRGAKPGEVRIERRRRHGLADVPPIAVVSGRCTLSPGDPVIADTVVPPIVVTTSSADAGRRAALADTVVPPIVVTTSSADAGRRAALADAGADVVVAGEHGVDLPLALRLLGERGLLRVNCEGGPHLFASLVADDLVDQLCLTLAPLLAGAGADRIVAGRATPAPRTLRLVSLLHEDGFTMFRYRRERDAAG